jgi:hypothetical protein
MTTPSAALPASSSVMTQSPKRLEGHPTGSKTTSFRQRTSSPETFPQATMVVFDRTSAVSLRISRPSEQPFEFVSFGLSRLSFFDDCYR